MGLLDPLHLPLLPPRDDQAGHPLPAAASALPVELVVAVGAQVSPSRVRRQHWAHAGAEPGPGPEPEPELFQRAPEAEGTAELRQRFESTPTSLGTLPLCGIDNYKAGDALCPAVSCSSREECELFFTSDVLKHLPDGGRQHPFERKSFGMLIRGVTRDGFELS